MSNTADTVVKIYGNLREDRGYLKSIVENDFYSLRDINISSDKIVIDLGAHIGMFSIYANKLFGCEVMAYEPEEGNHERLERNIRLNKGELTKQIWALKCGIWDGNIQPIYLDPEKRSYDSHTMFSKNNWKTKNTTHTWTPHAILGGHKQIGYLKSNCQGGEYYLLKYFKENPEILNKIDRIFIELHPHLTPKDKWNETVELVKWFKGVYTNPCRIQLAGVARKKYGDTGIKVDTF